MSSKKVFWITGLSGAGKSTTSLLLKEELIKRGFSPILIDGDSIREILGSRFTYSKEDRLYLAQCYGRLCKNLSEQNQMVICSTISMFDSIREWNRKNIKGYIEIYLKASTDLLKSRDPKGLYQQFTQGENSELVGVHTEFEEPKQPDLVFNACNNISVNIVVDHILTQCLEDIKNES